MFQIKEFSENLKKARTACGITQADLADRIQIGDGSISQWENGSSLPKLDYLFSLCRELRIPSDKLIGLHDKFSENEIQEFRGIKWKVRNIEDELFRSNDTILDGIELFNLILRENFGLTDLQLTSRFRFGETRLRHLLKVVLFSKAVELVDVPRDLDLETKLLEKYKHCMRQAFVAKLALPVDSLINSTIRIEAVAWLASKEACKYLPNAGLVGLTGGTTIARFVDLVPPAHPRVGGITWVPLLVSKTKSYVVSSSANNTVARMVYNQPGTLGYQLPYISYDCREGLGLTFQDADTCERDYARQVLEKAASVSDAFISVGSPEFNFQITDAYLGMPELLNLYQSLSSTEKTACVGDVLLSLIDKNGNRLGDIPTRKANEELVYSIGTDMLKVISQRGLVWILAARQSKAPVIHAALTGGLANCVVVDSSLAEALLNIY